MNYDTERQTELSEEELEVFYDEEIEGLANSFNYKPSQEEIKGVMSWATRVQLEHNLLSALIKGKAKIIGFKDGYPLLNESE